MLWRGVSLILAMSMWLPPASAHEVLPSGRAEARWDPAQAGYSLRATEAPLRVVAAELARVTGCRVDVEKKLGEQLVTLELSPRPAERLFYVLARRGSAWLDISHRLRPLAPLEAWRGGSSVFTDELVSLEISQPVELAEAVRRLPVPVSVEEGVRARVRVFAARHSLRKVLDSLAEHARAGWTTTVRLTPRSALDAEAAAEDRMRAHFSDLARLSSAERRGEIEADVEALSLLPPAKRGESVRRMADDVLSLGTVFASVPGEHRATVGSRLLAVARDYWTVVSGIPQDRRSELQPVLDAIRELDQKLRQLR
jgi:hypothetical protein